MIRSYIAFCIFYTLKDIVNPSVATICLYVEFLARSFTSHKSISNYVGGVRLLHKHLNVDAPSLSSYHLSLMLRACRLTIKPTHHRLPISSHMLFDLCKLCENIGSVGCMLKCVFLFAFWGFLRCFNLAHNSASQFDTKTPPLSGRCFLSHTQVIKY